MLAPEAEENEVKGVCLPLSWQKQQREETEASRVPRSKSIDQMPTDRKHLPNDHDSWILTSSDAVSKSDLI